MASRGNLRFALLAGASALVGSVTFPGAAHAQTLVVNSYGAEYEEIIFETIIRPFEEEFGVRVVYDPTGSAAEDYARIRATGGNPGFDVVVMTASEAILGCDEGLLAPLTEDRVPNMARLLPEVQSTVGECGAVHEIQYMALMYRTDFLDSPPTSWRIFEDPQYEGRYLLPNFNTIMGVFLTQVFSVMEGGTTEEIGPGFDYLATVAPGAVEFVQSSSIMANYIENGTVWMLPYWNARGALLKQDGLPVDFVIPEEGTIPLLATISIPAGAENLDLAYAFVNFWLEKDRQEAWAQAYNVGTIRDDVELPEDFRQDQITSAEDIQRLLLPDLRVLGQQRSTWAGRWMREISGLAR